MRLDLLSYRGYVDITNDLARDMSKLLAEEVDRASGEEDQVPLWAIF